MKIDVDDLLIIILILVFIFDMNLKHMNVLHWLGLAVSVIWLILFIVKLLTTKKKTNDEY